MWVKLCLLDAHADVAGSRMGHTQRPSNDSTRSPRLHSEGENLIELFAPGR